MRLRRTPLDGELVVRPVCALAKGARGALPLKSLRSKLHAVRDKEPTGILRTAPPFKDRTLCKASDGTEIDHMRSEHRCMHKDMRIHACLQAFHLASYLLATLARGQSASFGIF